MVEENLEEAELHGHQHRVEDHLAELVHVVLNQANHERRVEQIKEIVEEFADQVYYQVFDVRGSAEVPDTSHDIYISTGGPGSPLDGDGIWDKKYYDLLTDLWKYNEEMNSPKKHVLFICHSFQMACHHFQIAKITPRKSMSFGIFPVHKTPGGHKDSVLGDLPNPFWAADFRRFQVVQPNYERLEQLGAEILALEKIRPHVPLERAIMAVRFSEYFFGTQFHPEADPIGMREHFLDPERRRDVIRKHGEDKYFSMMEHMNDSEKLPLTHHHVIPKFLWLAIRDIQSAREKSKMDSSYHS